MTLRSQVFGVFGRKDWVVELGLDLRIKLKIKLVRA